VWEYKSWQISLYLNKEYYGGSDDYVHSNIKAEMSALFLEKNDFKFHLFPEFLFSSISKKFFGLQDIIIGDELFDDCFVIKSNDEEKMKELLQSARIKELLLSLPGMNLQTQSDTRWFRKVIPKGTTQLYFSCDDKKFDDKQVIKDLFELFSLVLDQLVQLNVSSAESTTLRIPR
jgi:hypothetical protein